MRRLPTGRLLFFVIVGVIVALALLLRLVTAERPVVINNTPVPPVPTLDSRSVTLGAALYIQYCAKCHGSRLEGAPDWKKPLADGSLPSPPHDSSGHTWHHSDALLLSIIAGGGEPASNSRMPAFKDRLSQEEMATILDFIKSQWGKEEREYQWWITKTSGKP